jgi:pimeloyl-ACP methyl ester carboxylesterase
LASALIVSCQAAFSDW